jgi:hypothetical protein
MILGFFIGFFSGIASSMVYSLYVRWITHRFIKGQINAMVFDTSRFDNQTRH